MESRKCHNPDKIDLRIGYPEVYLNIQITKRCFSQMMTLSCKLIKKVFNMWFSDKLGERKMGTRYSLKCVMHEMLKRSIYPEWL
jgi:hypothetical protein